MNFHRSGGRTRAGKRRTEEVRSAGGDQRKEPLLPNSGPRKFPYLSDVILTRLPLRLCLCVCTCAKAPPAPGAEIPKPLSSWSEPLFLVSAKDLAFDLAVALRLSPLGA